MMSFHYLIQSLVLLLIAYPIGLEIKNTTDTAMSASFRELHPEIDSEDRIRAKLYDKRDDFIFLLGTFH
jgi:hypothetical protein